MLTDGRVGIGKDHALIGKVLFQRTVDYFRSEVERLAEKHSVSWLLEPSKEDADYAYSAYIENGYMYFLSRTREKSQDAVR